MFFAQIIFGARWSWSFLRTVDKILFLLRLTATQAQQGEVTKEKDIFQSCFQQQQVQVSITHQDLFSTSLLPYSVFATYGHHHGYFSVEASRARQRVGGARLLERPRFFGARLRERYRGVRRRRRRSVLVCAPRQSQSICGRCAHRRPTTGGGEAGRPLSHPDDAAKTGEAAIRLLLVGLGAGSARDEGCTPIVRVGY